MLSWGQDEVGEARQGKARRRKLGPSNLEKWSTAAVDMDMLHQRGQMDWECFHGWLSCESAPRYAAEVRAAEGSIRCIRRYAPHTERQRQASS